MPEESKEIEVIKSEFFKTNLEVIKEQKQIKKKTQKTKSVANQNAEIVKESMIKLKGFNQPIHLGDARSVIEDPLVQLYPEGKDEFERARVFDKPTIFLTARVHCGEAAGSFFL